VNHKQKLQLLVGFLLAAGLLAWFLRGQNWSEIAAAFRRANLTCLAGLVAATLICYAVRAWRWGFLYRPLAPIPFKDLHSATYVGFMSGQLVPRAGEVLRPYLIARKHPVGTSAGFATIILERLIDLMTVLTLFALYLYVLPMPEQQVRGPLLDRLKIAGAITFVGALAVLAVLIAFHVYAERALAVADRVLAWLPAIVARPFRQLLKSFGEGLAVLKAPPSLWLAIAAQSAIIWLSIAGGFYLNNRAFGIVLPMHTAFLLIAFLTVGVAIPTPGNVGGFHAFYLAAMSDAFGVPKETAAAAGISAHALTNLTVLVLGLVFLAGEGLTMAKVAELAGQEGEARDGEGKK
jgi:uncharacterized protein (TIRG00374 family)